MRDNDTVTEKSGSSLTKWGIYALILLVVFLLGLIPMWMQKRDVVKELDTTQKQLRRAEIKGLLTTSIVESKRGEYETARKDTSEFFTRLNTEIEKGEESALTSDERGKLKQIFNNRDGTITLLAQRDQASTERLTDIYVDYQSAVGQTMTAAPKITPTGATTPATSPGSATPATAPATAPGTAPATEPTAQTKPTQ